MMRCIWALLLVTLVSGCATTAPGSKVLAPENCSLPYEISDPWEPFNRAVYRFNARVDEAVLLPVSRGYERVLPQPVRTGVSNFFSNLGELKNVINHTLQGRPGRTLQSLGRFVVNTTAGVAGLFDVASPIGLEHQPTGFGDTLARWGTAPGPYLVLPLLGPSSVRDGSGLLFDAGVAYNVDLAGLYQSDNSWMLGTLAGIDMRSNVDFRYYESASPFEYEMVRFLYSNQRMLESGLVLPDPEQCE